MGEFGVFSKPIKSLGKVITIACWGRVSEVDGVGDVFPKAMFSVVLEVEGWDQFAVLSKGIKSLGKVITIMCWRAGMVEDVGDVFPKAIYSVVLMVKGWVSLIWGLF